MPHSWSSRCALAGALVVAGPLLQRPGFRVAYAVRVLAGSDNPRVLAVGSVSGPEPTGLRLSVRTDAADLEALLGVSSDPDSVTLAGAFLTRRRAGRSRRGLPLWEEDSYRRVARLAWGRPVRLYPFGPAGEANGLWVELTVTRAMVAGETPPDEAYEATDSSVAVALEAVLAPRRARLRMLLADGDTTSAPEVLDLGVEGQSRRVTFVLGRRVKRALDVRLERPAPPPTLRDSALALDADVVCVRVTDPLLPEPSWAGCGRLNTVARRLPLSDRDTLVVAFAWPVAR